MKEFPSIDQLYHVFKRVRDRAQYNQLPQSELPVVEVVGRVKLHGTNAGIAISGLGARPVAQSRTRKIDVTSDNAGFAMFVTALPQDVIDRLYIEFNPTGKGTLTLFGEWCGGNIQSGVALNECPKHFVLFGAHLSDETDDGKFLKFNYDYTANEHGIYNIGQIPAYVVTIDFRKEDQTELETFLSELTNKVENECPWAKLMFNVSGIGEGLVWDQEYPFAGFYRFKTKGEKHSVRKSKVGKVVQADPEKAKNVTECVDIILTEARMQQMVDKYELAYTYQNIPEFLKQVCSDCAKEEIEVVIASGLEWGDVAKVIQNRARNWFLEKVKAI